MKKGRGRKNLQEEQSSTEAGGERREPEVDGKVRALFEFQLSRHILDGGSFRRQRGALDLLAVTFPL